MCFPHNSKSCRDTDLHETCADVLADNILGLPFGPYAGSIDRAADLLDEAVQLVSSSPE